MYIICLDQIEKCFKICHPPSLENTQKVVSVCDQLADVTSPYMFIMLKTFSLTRIKHGNLNVFQNIFKDLTYHWQITSLYHNNSS